MTALQVEAPAYMTEDLRIFEDGVAKFLEREAVPNNERYIAQHGVDRSLVEQGGRSRPPLRVHAGGIWRRRRQLRA
jgi:hypothetical protein